MKHRISRTHGVYVVGQLGLVGSTFIFNVFVARLLGPVEMGVWQTAILVATYGMMLMFGTLNGMGREIPYLRGGQDDDGVSESISSAFAFLTATTGLLVAVALLAEISGAAPLWLILGVGLLIARLANGFSMILLRSLQDFTRLGLHQGSTGGVLLLGIVWVGQHPSLQRVLVAMATALLIVILLAIPHIHLTRVSLARLRRLTSVGLPIMLAGVLFGLLTTVDRFLILGFLGTEWLGLYTPAITALGILTIAPGLVSNLMYPKLAHEFGRSEDVGKLMPFVKRMLQLNVAITLATALIFLISFYTVIIPFILPAYVDGRQPMSIVLVSALFLPIAQSFGDLFNVVGLQRRYLANMAMGFSANAIVGYVLVGPGGFGLSGVAIGTVVGTAVFAATQSYTYLGLQRQVVTR